MEPLPETDEALDEYLEDGDSDLREVLLDLGRRTVHIVPSCVGLSLGLVRENLTFTLVATSKEIAVIDAAQYLDGGPCVEVALGADLLDVDVRDLLDEDRWTAFALTSAAKGVRSTLSLPVERNGEVVGGINLYASDPAAFRGKHEELAASLGASYSRAIADSTRVASSESPPASKKSESTVTSSLSSTRRKIVVIAGGRTPVVVGVMSSPPGDGWGCRTGRGWRADPPCRSR